MPELNPQPLPPKSIRVHVPVAALHDIERFQEIQSSVLGELGCGGCTSGYDLLWQHYTDYAVNPAGQVQPLIGPGTIGIGR